MIAYLNGKLIHRQAPNIILDVAGVGYEVLVPMTVYYKLTELNSNLELYIYQYIREDSNILYGFNNLNQRKLFIELIKTNGVGPRLALTVLSNYQVHEFIYIIENSNSKALEKLPGVGKKTAQRLMIELKDRLGKIFKNTDNASHNDQSNNISHCSSEKSVNNIENYNCSVSDAIAALESLGYKSADAHKVVNKVASNANDASTEVLIKAALKEFR